jgi:predicted nucleotidyltransferase
MNVKMPTKGPANLEYYLDGSKIPMRVIRGYARQVAERFRPEKIILFGSQAYGEPNRDSDVDLLVVIPARDELSMAVKIQLAFESPPFPLDLIVRSPERLRRRLQQRDPFLTEITTKGKVLYEKGNKEMGQKSRGGSSHGRGNRTKRRARA